MTDTTRAESLEKLIAKVEAGDLGNGVISAFDTLEQVKLAVDAWRGSLDAAKALHDAVLPGWVYNLAPGFAHVFPTHDNGDQEALTGLSDCPARAWLLAILRALRAQQEGAKG